MAAEKKEDINHRDIPACMLPAEGDDDGVDWMCRVYRALEHVTVPLTRSRLNVRTRLDAPIRGMCLGCVHARGQGPVESASTRRHPVLTQLLVRFAKQSVPGIVFTSIQVNKNYMSALHIDRGNLGMSYIVGVGQYEGGGLWVQDDACDDGGMALNVRHEWQRFDGTRAHCTLPYAGTRYTLIYFTQRAHTGLSAANRARLTALGFPPIPPLAAAENDDTGKGGRCLNTARMAFLRWQCRHPVACQHAPLGVASSDQDAEVGVVAPAAAVHKRNVAVKRPRCCSSDTRCPDCPYQRQRERKDATGRLKSHCWRCLVDRRADRRRAAAAAAAAIRTPSHSGL